MAPSKSLSRQTAALLMALGFLARGRVGNIAGAAVRGGSCCGPDGLHALKEWSVGRVADAPEMNPGPASATHFSHKLWSFGYHSAWAH